MHFILFRSNRKMSWQQVSGHKCKSYMYQVDLQSAVHCTAHIFILIIFYHHIFKNKNYLINK